MRKKNLEKRLARLQTKLNEITARVSASTDVQEVRTLTAQADEIREDISDIKDEIAEIDAEEARGAAVSRETEIPANATLVASIKPAEQREENVLESMEYRKAFMAYVQKGTEIPAEFRAAAVNTGDTGAAIPVTVMNEVINTIRKRYGNLYRKTRSFRCW